MRIPLFGQTGEELYDDASSQLTQNWYPHISQEAKSGLMLYPTPALSVEVSNIGLSTVVIRGMIEYGGKLYVVSGGTFYRVESTGAFVALGTLNTNLGRVQLAHNGVNNGHEILIVDGTNGYIYDSVLGTVVQIADGDFPQTATHAQFIDGYFVVNDPSITGQFAISNLYEGTIWTGTDIATAERSPDKLQAVIVSDRVLYLIGEKTLEVWLNTGNPDFPFAPMQSGFSQWGTIAPHSPAEAAGIVFWMAHNEEGCGQVVMANGGQVQIISTSGIAAQLGKCKTLEDAYGWTYQYHHHTFYVLTLPTEQKTFVYDITTQKWHRWSTKDTGYHKASHHIHVYGKHYVGDNSSNTIYSLDWDSYKDGDENIVRIRRSRNITNDDPSKHLMHRAVHIDTKEGVGNADQPDPQLKLRWRDDNGAWSSYHSRSMGKIGERSKRLIWRRLGKSKDRVYEISTQDPVKCVLIDAWADLDSGNVEVSGD